MELQLLASYTALQYLSSPLLFFPRFRFKHCGNLYVILGYCDKSPLTVKITIPTRCTPDLVRTLEPNHLCTTTGTVCNPAAIINARVHLRVNTSNLA